MKHYLVFTEENCVDTYPNIIGIHADLSAAVQQALSLGGKFLEARNSSLVTGAREAVYTDMTHDNSRIQSIVCIVGIES